MSRARISRGLLLDVFQNAIILSFADVKDLARLRGASRLFWPLLNQVERAVFKSHCFSNYPWIQSLTSLQLLHLIDVDFIDSDLYRLRRLHLVEAVLSPRRKSRFATGLLALATNCPDMTSFTFNGGFLPDSVGVQLIHLMPKLTTFNIRSQGLDELFIHALHTFQQLTSMDLTISYDSIAHHVTRNSALGSYISAPHDSLVTLSLSITAEIACRPFSWGSYASLQCLIVNCAVYITDESLALLVKNTPCMTEFIYDEPQFTSIEPFAQWRDLHTLHVRDIEMSDRGDVPGLEHVLQSCSKIRVVNICGCVIYGPAIPVLVARFCKNLEAAIITWNVSTECLVLLLARCKKLKRLYIELTTLSNVDLCILNEMCLTDLHLSYFAESADTTGGASTETFETFANCFKSRLTVDESLCNYFEMNRADLSVYSVKVVDYL